MDTPADVPGYFDSLDARHPPRGIRGIGLGPPPALAHEERDAGGVQFVVGWGDEPAFSGAKNAVEVDPHAAGNNKLWGAALIQQGHIEAEDFLIVCQPDPLFLLAGGPGQAAGACCWPAVAARPTCGRCSVSTSVRQPAHLGDTVGHSARLT